MKVYYHVHKSLLLVSNLSQVHLDPTFPFYFSKIHYITILPGPNILLSTLFTNTLNLCSSFNMKDQVSYP